MIHNLNVRKNDNHPIPQNFQKNVFWKKIEQKAKGKFKNKI